MRALARFRQWLIYAFGGTAEVCQFCAHLSPSWFTSNDLWLAAMGHRGGFCCPSCFTDRVFGWTGHAVAFQAIVPEMHTCPDCGIDYVGENDACMPCLIRRAS